MTRGGRLLARSESAEIERLLARGELDASDLRAVRRNELRARARWLVRRESETDLQDSM